MKQKSMSAEQAHLFNYYSQLKEFRRWEMEQVFHDGVPIYEGKMLDDSKEAIDRELMQLEIKLAPFILNKAA